MGYPQIMFVLNNKYRSGFTSLKMLPNGFLTLAVGFVYKRFSPFIEIMNEKLLEVVASGLTNYWIEIRLNPKGLRRIVEEIGPQVLTMEHLEVGFFICLAPLVLSIIVFALEIALHRFYC